MVSMPDLRARADAVYRILDARYPDSRPLLNFRSPFELLIAVILSAQTTDRQVNEVTGKLFSRFPDAARLAAADVAEIEAIVRSTGFYRQKAKNIRAAAAGLVEGFDGEVPGTMEELTSLPGVGRKSANVVLGHVFGRPAVIVDTHFSRVCGRLGLSSAANPDGIEREIRELIPPERQTRFSMTVNFHGRDICFARKPNCRECPLLALCPYGQRTGAPDQSIRS